jgi:hypothetical protein
LARAVTEILEEAGYVIVYHVLCIREKPENQWVTKI